MKHLVHHVRAVRLRLFPFGSCAARIACLAAILGGISGCGPSRPTTYPVSGVVTLDGKPIQGATVMLMPQAGGRPATGTTNQRGEFSLTTFDRNDGALPGKHTVTVVKKITTGIMAGPDGLSGPVARGGIKEQWIIPKKYSDPKSSILSADVRRGMEPLKLDLRSQ
jgi:hypothetical protein